MKTKRQTIGVVGLWHMGEVYAACLADLGHTVIGFDSDRGVVSGLSRGIPPLPEPGLAAMIRRNISRKRLSFSHAFPHLKKCDAVWLTFDIPVGEEDAVDLRLLWRFLDSPGVFFKPGVLIIVSSQVPAGTCDAIARRIAESRPGLRFDLAYVPENLQLGRAINEFFKPGRIVIGATKQAVTEKVKGMFSPLVPDFLPMKVASAEIAKHALNCFLAASLSFIYDIADLCTAYGADVVDVAKALRSDPRIGSQAYLDASIGFSAGTLARDVRSLIDLGKRAHIETPVIAAVLEKNSHRRELLIHRLEHYLGSLRGKKIGVLGLTYKPGTSTLRRALSLEIIEKLNAKGVNVRTHDPAVTREEVERLVRADFFDDPYRCLTGCMAGLFLTDWPAFKTLDMKKIKMQMKQPFLFFDTRNSFYDRESEIKKTGFLYVGIGR